jgi:hypothetical protein
MSKGFAIKNTEQELADLEAAIKAEEEKNNPAPVVPDEPVPATQTEKVYEKRYSDLRSFAAKKENELRAALAEKERQIQELSGSQMKFPKSPEEVSAWAQKYPDVYDLVVTIAKQNAIEVTKGLDEKVKAQDERDYAYVKKLAVDQLTAAHPDFWELKDTDDFTAWLETQPLYIYNALYENETDALSAIRAVDLYKADKNIGKKTQKKEETKEFAENPVRGRGTSEPLGNTELKYTESKVAAMPWREQEKNIAEIEKCMANPAFYDLSGGAR